MSGGKVDFTEDMEEKARKVQNGGEHLSTSASVANSFEKARAADFLGSLKQTRSEKLQQDIVEELERYAKMIEGLAEGAIKYAAVEGEFHAILGFDDLRRAAKKLRKPDPTPVPRL